MWDFLSFNVGALAVLLGAFVLPIVVINEVLVRSFKDQMSNMHSRLRDAVLAAYQRMNVMELVYYISACGCLVLALLSWQYWKMVRVPQWMSWTPLLLVAVIFFVYGFESLVRSLVESRTLTFWTALNRATKLGQLPQCQGVITQILSLSGVASVQITIRSVGDGRPERSFVFEAAPCYSHWSYSALVNGDLVLVFFTEPSSDVPDVQPCIQHMMFLDSKEKLDRYFLL